MNSRRFASTTWFRDRSKTKHAWRGQRDNKNHTKREFMKIVAGELGRKIEMSVDSILFSLVPDHFRFPPFLDVCAGGVCVCVA